MNRQEDAALQGLSLEAQIIYLRGIRPFMDYETGIAGIERKINRASLSEVCHVVPAAQSHKKESRPTWDAVRRRLNELEAAGLIIQKPNLIFELVLATRDKSVQNMMTRQMTPMMTPTKPFSTNGLNGDDDTHDDTHDDTTSVITTTTTTDSRQKIRMTLDWKPTVLFEKRAAMQGVLPSKITPEVIGGFICHYEGLPEEKQQDNTQSQWENALVKWIKGEWEKKPSTRPQAPYQPKKQPIDEPRMNIPAYVPEPAKERIVRPRTTALSDIFKND